MKVVSFVNVLSIMIGALLGSVAFGWTPTGRFSGKTLAGSLSRPALPHARTVDVETMAMMNLAEFCSGGSDTEDYGAIAVSDECSVEDQEAIAAWLLERSDILLERSRQMKTLAGRLRQLSSSHDHQHDERDVESLLASIRHLLSLDKAVTSNNRQVASF